MSHVEVISGVEEARLIHLGVLQAVPVFDQRMVLIDIGGGSTEILVGERGETLAAGSLKLGAIRLTRRFFRSDSLHPGAVDSCRRHIRSALAPMAREVERTGFEVAVASSGTVEAVIAMVHAMRDDGPTPRSFNNASVSRREVAAVVKELAAASTVDERRELPGIDQSRVDIVLGGALILDAGAVVARDRGAGLLRLRTARGGPARRAGPAPRGHPPPPARPTPSQRRAPRRGHGRRTRALRAHRRLSPSSSSTAPPGGIGLDDSWRELLEAAALLANVGQFISHSEHHKHSYYVIRHSDRLSGFTDHEIELIALVARYHRKSAPKPKHPEFACLRTDDQVAVTALAGILRIAIALDRSHRGPVERVQVTSANGSGPLRVVVHGRPGADLSLELHTGAERKEPPGAGARSPSSTWWPAELSAR